MDLDSMHRLDRALSSFTYCVKYSALDALSMGYKVTVIREAVKGVDLSSGDSEKALKEIQEKGARITSSSSITN